jgi:hypothetical protein
MSGPVVATGASVRSHAVVDLQGPTLDDDLNAEAVGPGPSPVRLL